MDIVEEGHIGLSNKKVEETTSENFRLALSCLEKGPHTAYFVIHIYSTHYELGSPYLQRSNIGATKHKKNFLERIGFTHYSSCNILGGECYFKVIEEVNRDQFLENFAYMQRNQIVYDRFRRFASQIGDVYKRMREIDQMLFSAGFELPWVELSLSPIDYGKEEKVYPKGYAYYAYKDILDIIRRAKNEVIVADNYVDEELINLHLEKIPEKVRIRVLTKEPKGNFMVVAKKFSSRPNVDFEVRKSMEWHDRWFFIDNGCWVLGQSVKDAGTKPTYLIKLETYDLLRKAFDEIWSKASRIV
jgi:ribosomal protein L31E